LLEAGFTEAEATKHLELMTTPEIKAILKDTTDEAVKRGPRLGI